MENERHCDFVITIATAKADIKRLFIHDMVVRQSRGKIVSANDYWLSMSTCVVRWVRGWDIWRRFQTTVFANRCKLDGRAGLEESASVRGGGQ